MQLNRVAMILEDYHYCRANASTPYHFVKYYQFLKCDHITLVPIFTSFIALSYPLICLFHVQEKDGFCVYKLQINLNLFAVGAGQPLSTRSRNIEFTTILRTDDMKAILRYGIMPTLAGPSIVVPPPPALPEDSFCQYSDGSWSEEW